MSADNTVLDKVTSQEYKHGFYTEIESDSFPVGLNEEVVAAISKRKGGPPTIDGDLWTDI